MTIAILKLKHAVAVARAGSFSIAADVINISQSALTRSVQILEETYGICLFQRGKSGARLTPDGARFIAIAEDALIRAQSTHEELMLVAQHQEPPVCLAIGSLSAASFLPRLLPILTEQGVRHRIRIESNTMMQLMLRQGDIDFFVGGLRKDSEGQGTGSNFRIQWVPGGEVGVLLREGHPLLSEALTPENIGKYPTAAGSFVREMLGSAWLDGMGLQQPSIELDDYSLLMSFVRGNDHLMIASSMLLDSATAIGLKPLLSVSVADRIDWAVVSSASRELSQAANYAASLTFDLMSRMLSSGHAA